MSDLYGRNGRGVVANVRIHQIQQNLLRKFIKSPNFGIFSVVFTTIVEFIKHNDANCSEFHHMAFLEGVHSNIPVHANLGIACYLRPIVGDFHRF